MNIILVEDDPQLRLLLSSVLTDEGHIVWSYVSSRDALSKLENDLVVDLVITDFLMDGMDGIELASRLIANGHTQRVLVITGKADEARRRTQGRAGFTVLGKPFDQAALFAAVEVPA